MKTNVAIVAVDLPVEEYELGAIAAAARLGDWSTTLVHVVQPHVPVSGTEFGTYVDPNSVGITGEREELGRAAEQLVEMGIAADARVLVGTPVSSIIAISRELEAQVIIALCRKHNLVHRIVVGSILSSLLKAADRPLLVLPAPEVVEADLQAAIDRFLEVAHRTSDRDLKEIHSASSELRHNPESSEAQHAVRDAVARLQGAHPDLVHAANDISYFLSGMGI